MGSVTRAALDQKLAVAKRCSHGIIIYASTSLLLNLPFLNLWFLPHLSLEQLAEGAMAGAKAAVIATVAAAVPTVASVRMLPWARSNLNPTAQALIISTGY
ncbi:hypothetical protein BHM03_00026242 [Ensete ventricosum]|nr:hypothetical protein BHM03_00026242 [Ensete ventricosum]